MNLKHAMQWSIIRLKVCDYNDFLKHTQMAGHIIKRHARICEHSTYYLCTVWHLYMSEPRSKFKDGKSAD